MTDIYEIETHSGDVSLTAEDIDDILSAALDGDITPMWCVRVESVLAEPCNSDGVPVSVHKNGYAAGTLTDGGKVIFELIENDGTCTMTMYDFAKGFRIWINENPDMLDAYNCVDIGQIDAVEADVIVQYALFGELVYG